MLNNKWPKRIKIVPANQLAILERLAQNPKECGQPIATEPQSPSEFNSRTLKILSEFGFIEFCEQGIYLTWRGRGYLDNVHTQQQNGSLY